jgi:hypothetical protein
LAVICSDSSEPKKRDEEEMVTGDERDMVGRSQSRDLADLAVSSFQWVNQLRGSQKVPCIHIGVCTIYMYRCSLGTLASSKYTGKLV